MYFGLHWVFVAELQLFLVVASRGYSPLQYAGFSLQWLLLWSMACGAGGLQYPWHTGSVVAACGL